jgi:hypothetical protein
MVILFMETIQFRYTGAGMICHLKNRRDLTISPVWLTFPNDSVVEPFSSDSFDMQTGSASFFPEVSAHFSSLMRRFCRTGDLLIKRFDTD